MCLQFNGMRFSTSTPTTQCIQLFESKFPAVFHCQKVTDHSPCLPHFLLLNAESKSLSRTDEIRHYDCHVKFENNTSGRARLWDTALKFLCPGLSITSPDHLEDVARKPATRLTRASGEEKTPSFPGFLFPVSPSRWKKDTGRGWPRDHL